MEIFFSCSTDNILKYSEEYLEIVNSIKKEGHHLTRNWLEKSIELAEDAKEDVSRDVLYSDVMSAIISADVAIFDCTVQSMSIGHQLTFALDKSKPTLLMAKKDDESIENLFISGSKSSYLTLKNYNSKDDIRDIVKSFLAKNSSKSKVRFQVVLEKPQHDYLEWAAFRYKKNKSDVVKDSLDHTSENDDEYQTHLINQP